jgi:hypothetical protein
MGERREPRGHATSAGAEGCGLYRAIDALEEAKTVAGLVRRLKPILSELAYHAVMGEGSVLDAREEWREQYLAALREDMPAARAPSRAGRHKRTQRRKVRLV